MALLLHYIGTAAAAVGTSWRQNKAPEWDKNYVGETDTCRVTYQGPHYLEKAFLDALTEYQDLVYKDENGATNTDAGMFLTKASSDNAPIFPTVTLHFEGCRNGTTPDPLATDDKVVQSASTTFTITDDTSPNYGKGITMSIQYYAARTSYEWAQLTDPAGVATHNTLRNPITYTGPFGDIDIFQTRFSGMVDEDGNSSRTISTADATAVWNSFVYTSVVAGPQTREVVPGELWKCSATVEGLLVGTS